MQVVLQFVPLLLFLAILALCVHVSGRLLAATRIPWFLCFKYAALVVLLLIPVRVLAAPYGHAGTWAGVVVAIGLHAIVGAFYLGPRVKKESGYDLGPITGAKVATGAALVAVATGFGLAILAGVLGAFAT